MGFENLVFARVHLNEKEVRRKNKELEFFWRPFFSDDKGSSKLFTHVLYDHYNPPKGTGLIQIISNPRFDNIETYADYILTWADRTRSNYLTNNRLILIGDDFMFKEANIDFNNIDRVINYIKNNKEMSKKINIFYSTTEKYFDSLHQANVVFPSYNDLDFLPYSSEKYVYWTGFFSSRPYLKGLVRTSGKYLSATSTLYLEELFQITYQYISM